MTIDVDLKLIYSSFHNDNRLIIKESEYLSIPTDNLVSTCLYCCFRF